MKWGTMFAVAGGILLMLSMLAFFIYLTVVTIRQHRAGTIQRAVDQARYNRFLELLRDVKGRLMNGSGS